MQLVRTRRLNEQPGRVEQADTGLGLGTMLWGDTPLDRFMNDRVLSDAELKDLRIQAIASNIRFIDTAEGYGGGSCERRIRRCGFADGSFYVATKYLPTVLRWTPQSVVRAARRSAERMGAGSIHLLYIHSPTHVLSPDTWIRGAVRAVRAGVVQEIGVSNFNASQIQDAVRVAGEAGVPISSCQIQFSPLVYGGTEVRRILEVCREHGIPVVGFSTIGQGLLRDGLTPAGLASIRLARINGMHFDDIRELRRRIYRIATKHQITMAQACIQWSRAKGVFPLMGTRTASQLRNSRDSQRVKLSGEDVEDIDAAALDYGTFRKSPSRRMLFMVLISTLVLSFKVSRAFQ